MASRRLTGTSYFSAASSNSATSEEYGESWAKTFSEPITPSSAAPKIPTPLSLRKSRRLTVPGGPIEPLEYIPPPRNNIYLFHLFYRLQRPAERVNLTRHPTRRRYEIHQR